ncbi:MAG: hypothetical protein ACOC44_06225 [Promethearchaeia archaeon]
MKTKFLIVSLTSCSGCISTLMSLDIFPLFLERADLSHFPFISDIETIEECDIALIEGCVSQSNQITILKNIRKNAKKIYALGTCAAFGGIMSLSEDKPSAAISDFIEIDGVIPGCPVPSKLLGNYIIQLMENKDLELPLKNVCASCPLRDDMNFESKIKIKKLYPSERDFEELEKSPECFLKHGILCLGPITRDGCEHRCIEQGFTCEGCMGPVSKDFTANIINFLSLIELSEDLRIYKGIFYRFAKPKMKMEEFQ